MYCVPIFFFLTVSCSSLPFIENLYSINDSTSVSERKKQR